MTAPVFTPISDPLYALCPECRAMETLDAATGRCRACWRAWRWSPLGWVIGDDVGKLSPTYMPPSKEREERRADEKEKA